MVFSFSDGLLLFAYVKKKHIFSFTSEFPALFLCTDSRWWMACIRLFFYLYYSVRKTRDISERDREEKRTLASVEQHMSLLPNWSWKVEAELLSWEHVEQRGEAEQRIMRGRVQDGPEVSFHVMGKNFLTTDLNTFQC